MNEVKKFFRRDRSVSGNMKETSPSSNHTESSTRSRSRSRPRSYKLGGTARSLRVVSPTIDNNDSNFIIHHEHQDEGQPPTNAGKLHKKSKRTERPTAQPSTLPESRAAPVETESTPGEVPPGTALSPPSLADGFPNQVSTDRTQSLAQHSSQPQAQSYNPTSRTWSLPKHSSIHINPQKGAPPTSRFGEEVADRNILTHRRMAPVPPVPKVPDGMATTQQGRTLSLQQHSSKFMSSSNGKIASPPSGVKTPSSYQPQNTPTPPQRNVNGSGNAAAMPRASSKTPSVNNSNTLPIADSVRAPISASASSRSLLPGGGTRRSAKMNKFSSAAFYQTPASPPRPSFAEGDMYAL